MKSKYTRKRAVLAALGWFDPRFIVGIGRYAREAGWHLEARCMLEATYPTKWQGDGVIIQNSATRPMREFIQSHVGKQPIVIFDGEVQGLRLPLVTTDNFHAGRLAATHFLNCGHRNFVWIGVSRGSIERDRRDGFVQTLADAGKRCTVLRWTSGAGNTTDWKRRKFWMSGQLKKVAKPLAAFAIDDLLAADVIEAAFDARLKVPDDVAVIGVGNIETACECSSVPISSVDLNLGEVAYRAAHLLGQVMSGQRVARNPIVIPARGLVLRKSSDTLAVVHPGLSRALKFIADRYADDIGIEEIARAGGVSRRGIQYAFVRELRRTAAQHLLGVRLDRAKRRLIETQDKLEPIAEQCGFKSVRNLHRCFIREFAMAPRTWRNQQSFPSQAIT
ncbi:putative Transcriptional regulator, AraC family [uncultured Defluviicoccus sp.]|uniref:Putative Transcriptional regulator, AraC family n=1 Tax=metagenome TaxID=256318 RepID=A0A380TFR9_9ZZZZ|nr:putative Transcriptional regulator, AraC family [uncultured Defluviicoccus sp.]